MSHSDLIKQFYTSFSKGDAKGMIECYHKDIKFEDPAFGVIKGERACSMWKMLLSQKKGDLKVTFKNIETDKEEGKAYWEAEYLYGEQQRKVVNKVFASFKFKDGLIIEHIDTFDVWKWTKQAMGAVGYVLGWSSFMKSKIQQETKRKLDVFMEKR